MLRSILVAAVLTALPAVTFAASVDLTGWTSNNYRNVANQGNWNVGAGNDSVVQTVNGYPTVFFDPGSNAQGNALSGTIEVQTTGDDDFVGFVLGYQDQELNSTNADFWLIDWKQLNQSPAVDGLALSHVTGNIAARSDPFGSFWDHTDEVSEKARATNLGSTGWADNTEYTFKLTFTDSLIEVFVDNVLEISYSQADNGGNAFSDGSFGFYNFSQNPVRYAGVTEDTLQPVPLPAGLPLLLVGLGAFGLMRRRQA